MNDVVEHLLNLGADANAADGFALLVAANVGNDDAIVKLVMHNFDLARYGRKALEKIEQQHKQSDTARLLRKLLNAS